VAAELVTPVDELTGLPLPLAPSESPLPFNQPEQADWHHHFHPRRNPLLAGVGGIAVRNCRLQLANWREHHINYHGSFIGPPIPTTPEKQFETVVLAYAGAVPEHAIDVTRRKPRIVPIMPEQRDRLWHSGELRAAGSDSIIRGFLASYTIEQNLSHLSESIIDEFLNTEVDERRRYLGHLLLAKAIEKATEPIDMKYRRAWKSSLIDPVLPAKSPSFVTVALGPPRRRYKIISQLRQRLAA
jgi:hypothetical protein